MTKAKTKCNLYFKEPPVPISDKVIEFAQTDTINLASDEAGNIRYIGKNPNNYVTFNGEQWRIIGTFKDIDDGTGKLEWRAKIIRNESIGVKKWDAADDNDWTTASLKDELNGSYLSGLSTEAKEMIGQAKWNIKMIDYEETTHGPLYFYNKVRGGLTWLGQIALMDVSDYGYAVGGTSRSLCLNTSMYDWDSHSECANNDWLFNVGWTLTVGPGSPFEVIGYGGYVGDTNHSSDNNYIFPALYLSSNVMISGGSGTSADPYQLTV